MSCFLVLNSFAGNDQEAAAKKLALMFRMAPQQANAIIDRVSKGQVWRTPKEVSDRQAAVAENYLKGIGFQVERSGLQDVVDQILETSTLVEEPPKAGAGPGHSGSGNQVEAGPPGQPPRTRRNQAGAPPQQVRH